MLHLQNQLDDAKCHAEVRRRRGPGGVRCPHCASSEVARQGCGTAQPSRRKYRCTACRHYFDGLTSTILAGHKGHPEAVKKRPQGAMPKAEGRTRVRHAGEGEASGLRDARRGGEVAVRILADVRQKTIKPPVLATVAPGATVYTDEYGDGFHEVYVNAVEGK